MSTKRDSLRISDTQFVRNGIIITKWRNEQIKRPWISDTQLFALEYSKMAKKGLQVSVTHFVRIIIWNNYNKVIWRPWLQNSENHFVCKGKIWEFTVLYHIYFLYILYNLQHKLLSYLIVQHKNLNKSVCVSASICKEISLQKEILVLAGKNARK
jgi:hypothetical protein